MTQLHYMCLQQPKELLIENLWLHCDSWPWSLNQHSISGYNVDTRPCDLSSLLCPLQYVWPYDLIQWPCSHESPIAKCIHTSNRKVVGVMPRLEHSDWVFQCFPKWPLKLTHLWHDMCVLFLLLTIRRHDL